jgi:hypothetical protein
MAHQGDFTSGDVLNAADLNGFGNVTLVQKSGMSCPNNANTTVIFDTQIIDVDQWFTPPSANITPTISGVYLVTCNVIGLDSNNRGLVNLQRNSATVASEDQDGGRDFSVAAHITLTAGDNVAAIIYHNAGTTRTPDVTLGVQLIRAT